MTLPSSSIGSYSGYPSSQLAFLRCQKDAGELELFSSSAASEGFIWEGILRCRICDNQYQIVDGIVRMLDDQGLDRESLHELHLRDKQNELMPDFPDTPSANYWNSLEMEPTLAALAVDNCEAVLELACGAGRYTTILIGKCRALVAVDFSLAALRALAGKVPGGSNVGLVQADITCLKVAPRSFDRVLSTTCLDNREQRMAMHRLAANSLADGGRYVFSNEYYNLQTRMLGLPRVTRYTPEGMLFCSLGKNEVKRETAPFFRHVKVRSIQVPLPFTDTLQFSHRKMLARAAARLPVIKELGALLLVHAETPFRAPIEGEAPEGSKLARAIYRWYKRRRSQAFHG